MPHRAGKAVKYLPLVEQYVQDEPRRQRERLARLERDRSGSKRGRRGRQPIGTITVRAVMRPEPDVDRIARIIVEMAVERAREDAAREARAERTAEDDDTPTDRAA
ncbi:hypothetical protein GCM10027070_25560 [Barrientosiimonas humi]|uniref:hypothetical protein n=1 Tax=Barrientosiimonas humi TaxID=999931 RepID=UPI00114D74B4|nr:hypothetical protein [Barrientosiimonas humi]